MMCVGYFPPLCGACRINLHSEDEIAFLQSNCEREEMYLLRFTRGTFKFAQIFEKVSSLASCNANSPA